MSENTTLPVVRSFGLTDVGRKRSANEDQFLIAEMARTMWVRQSSLPQKKIQHGDHHAHVFLVADGMGGHNAGEVASALTVDTMESFILNVLHRFSNLRSSDEASVAAEFQEGLHQARTRILDEAAQRPELAGMGTTFTMAFSSDWKLFVVHAGDSRCYLFRSGNLQQLTSDHTVVAELVRRGAVKPEDAAHHQFRHVVTNAVGGNSPQLKVEVKTLKLQPQDWILLCSDGLSDMLAADRITTVLHQESDPQAICARLVAEANQEGGRDNITVIAACFAAGQD